ncbi:MAG: hypothetical protein LBB76_03430 [Azoarcus sp.]|nr:hypothetical protein [Azoarcus sp.]
MNTTQSRIRPWLAILAAVGLFMAQGAMAEVVGTGGDKGGGKGDQVKPPPPPGDPSPVLVPPRPAK